MSSSLPPSPRRWGHAPDVADLFTGAAWVVVLGVAGMLAGCVLGALLGWLVCVFFSDPRLGGWELTGTHAILFAAPGMALALLAVVLQAHVRAPMEVYLREEDLLVRGLGPSVRLRPEEVEDARVVVLGSGGEVGERALVLSTRWRDVVVRADRLVPGVDAALQAKVFEELAGAVGAWLERGGAPLLWGVPASSVLCWQRPVRWLLAWPHRRWLVARSRRWRLGASPPDHTRRLPPLAWAWQLRGRRWWLLVAAAALVAAFWAWEAPWAPWALQGVGLLAGPLLWALNAGLDAAARASGPGRVAPEAWIGRSEVPRRGGGSRWLPAPRCEVDFGGREVRRPDGRLLGFDEVVEVVYGPPSSLSGDLVERSFAASAWHLALTTASGAGRPVAIYGNASVDMVRYGDLDAGYAAYNWGLARALALACASPLRLAQGRLAATQVGRSLIEQVGSDVTRYDPAPLEAALQARGARRGVHLQSSPEHLLAWGALARRPEASATPPLYKLLAAAGLAALGCAGWPLAGLLVSYLLARSLSEWISLRHAETPGFLLRGDGIWVRGEHLPWEEAECATLMPVTAGPILFCGSSRVLVVGHLGRSYEERAWLGCAAWAWLQRRAEGPGEAR